MEIKGNKITLFFLIIYLFSTLAACSNSNNKLINPYAVVINSEDKDNLLVLDEHFNILKKITPGIYLEDIEVYENQLYVIDTGLLEKPQKTLVKINLNDFSMSKLVLPYTPHLMVINKGIAYISSSESNREQGFYLMAVDLKKFSITNVSYTKGITSFLVEDNGYVYAGINTGGKSNFGTKAQILEINSNKSKKIISKDILDENEELPPSSIAQMGNLIFGIYPGFAYGPKPRWLNQPENYTNKLKIINLNSGKIVNVLNLPFDFPQNMIIKDNLGFVNYFSLLDLRGDKLSVIDLRTNKIIKNITVSSPNSIAINEKNLLVTNYNTNSLTVFDSNSFFKLKEITVGKWPNKVIVIH